MAAPISFEETKRKILSILEGNKYFDKTFAYLNDIESTIRNIDETDEAYRWLSWARQNRHLKVISADVPQLILPDDYQGVLHDVKVFVKYGPDDSVYDNNKDIRDRVARGNCFLELTNKTPQTFCALQAMKKFTGGLGDDDDRESGDDMVWQKYFTKPIEETSVVIATKKANGEAAHLSCVQINGDYILCGGSKNVHLLFKKKADIDKYVEPRYRIATEVCHTVIDFLDKMSADDRQNLLSFLVASRFTAVFEILSPLHQHVVNLSSLQKPQLKFISWTKCELKPSQELKHLNIVPPSVGIEIARALGLDPVEYDEIPMADLNTHMKKIRFGFNYEGEVLYFLDKDGYVIGLLKKKTTWYIMCRAIREKIKAASHRTINKPETFSKSKSLNQLEKRILEIQQWLGLDHETTKQWKELGEKCMKWTLHELDNGGIQLTDIQDIFPVVWNTFRVSNSLDPDQDRQNIGPDLDPNCSTLQTLISWIIYIYKPHHKKTRTKFLEATGETDQFEMNLNSLGSSASSGACG